MRLVSAENKSVNQQHLVKYTQRVYIIVLVKGDCAIYYFFINTNLIYLWEKNSWLNIPFVLQSH